MSSKKINIMLVGAGRGSLDLIGMLSGEDSVQILGVVDANPKAPGMKLAKKLSLPTAQDWRPFLKKKGLSGIIDVTGNTQVHTALVKEKPAGVGIMDASSVKMMWRFVERKERLTEELRKIVSRVFERSPNIVLIADNKGKAEYVNSNFTQITGYGSEEIIGKNMRNLYEQSQKESKKMWTVIKAGKEWRGEFHSKKKNGEYYWEFASVTALKGPKDEIANFLKVGVDITARKRAEEALERDYRSTRRIIENAPFGIYVVTKEGNVDYVNPAMLKITGETYKKFLHLKVFELPAFVEIGLVEKIKAGLGGKYFKINAVAYTSFYSKKTSIINFIGIPLEEEGLRKVLVIVEDITEQKKAEQHLQKVNEELKKIDQMKSDFISTVSHQFRTPLTSIREAVAQALDEIMGKLNPDQKELLLVALESTDHLWKIVSNLLDISKIEADRIELRRTLVDITGVIKDVGHGFYSLLRNKNLTLDYSLPKESVDLFIDIEKIRHVISNLLSNACKFTNQGEKITILLKNKKTEVEIAVQDTGMGIAAANIPKLFDKFTQFGRPPKRGEKGTGLGLAIAKSMVELHGGKIWTKSKVGQGSTFTLSLPKVKSEVIFREYIDTEIKEAISEETVLSIIVLKIEDFEKLDKLFPGLTAHDVLKGLEGDVKKLLRKNMDTILKDTGECVILLYGTDRLGATIVKNKIGEVVRRYVDDFRKKHKNILKIDTGTSTYPEEAETSEELLLKARVKLKGIFLGAERRRHPRLTYNIDVKFIKGSGEIKDTQSVDISEGGICISSDHYIKVGTESELILELPKDLGSVRVKVKVRWIKRVEETKEYRVGLEFSQMSAEDRNKFEKFLKAGGR